MQVPLSRLGLSGDCDTYLAICDRDNRDNRDNCYGFLFHDQGGVRSAQWQSSSTTCSSFGPHTAWNAQHLWDFRFELSPSHTLTMAWSGTANTGHYETYDTMTASGGLWMTVCRKEANERQEIRLIEVSVKTT